MQIYTRVICGFEYARSQMCVRSHTGAVKIHGTATAATGYCTNALVGTLAPSYRWALCITRPRVWVWIDAKRQIRQINMEINLIESNES